ncbi:MarR family winged helix-turn-helix transcriptional regulator [Vibrio gallicus]|uniref:MarR family winged helix-turn-helix transcriptional regulator n=1 Tax=Vibrio gallicus TaxID=190897 RepID=UPI0021C2C9EB|nr:MarR family winged helix-turn-helix transcriptional regulator [Vibrio gallicus]
MGFAYKQFRAKVSHELFEALGISLEMFGALKVLNAHGKMTQQQLSDLLLRNRSVTKRLVDNAIKLNLIEPSKSETNKKIKLLALTIEGQKAVAECSPIVDKISHQLQDSLSKGESLQLTQLLAKLVKKEQFVD